MSAYVFDIERVTLTLHGVSQQIAEAAVADLDQALRRRLGAFQARDLALQDFSVLAIGPIESGATLDAAALRGLIAERLAQALLRPPHQAPAPDGGRE